MSNATRGMIATTMDLSSIRGLATAFPLYFAGLPLSDSGDHSIGMLTQKCRGLPSSLPRIALPIRCLVLDVYALLVELRCAVEIGGALGGELDVPCDIPDEAGQLSGDRDTAFVLRHLASGVELLEAIGQARLRFPGDVTNDFGLTALAHFDWAADTRVEAVRPGRLDQDASGLFVAGSCDRSLVAIASGGELRRHQSQIRHQGSRVGKAGEVPEFGDQRHGGEKINAAQTHQGRDYRPHPPTLALFVQPLRQPIDTLLRLFDRLTILVESDLLGRMLEAYGRQMPFVRLRPGTLALIDASMSQQHCLELLTGLKTCSDDIFARSAQIAHGFIARIRNGDGGEVARTRLSGQQQRIAPVGLQSLLSGLACDARGGDDLASPALLTQIAGPSIAAGTGFVNQQAVSRSAALAPQRLAQLCWKGIDRSHKPRRRAPGLCNRNRDRILMNIQANVRSDNLFHGLSPGLSGTTNPSGSVRVALRTHLRNPRYCREADHYLPLLATHKPPGSILLSVGHEV